MKNIPQSTSLTVSSLDQGNYQANPKPLSAPPVFPPNEMFNPYRFMGNGHPTSMNSTITSNGSMDMKNPMQYPQTTKVPTETYATSATTLTTTTPLASSSSIRPMPFDQMSAYGIPKHWIWSRNLFYPHLNSGHLLYSNSSGAFSGSDLSSPRGSTKTESLNSNSPAQITEINSDDDSLESPGVEKVEGNAMTM